MAKALKANDPLAELVSISSNVPNTPIQGVVPLSAEVQKASPAAAIADVQRLIPPLQADAGLTVTQTGNMQTPGTHIPPVAIVKATEPTQAQFPLQNATAALPTVAHSTPLPPPLMPGVQQQIPNQQVNQMAHDETHDGEGDDFFDPTALDEEFDPAEFDVPVPIAGPSPTMPSFNQATSQPAAAPAAAPANPNSPPWEGGTPVPPPSPTAAQEPAAAAPTPPVAEEGKKRKRRTKEQIAADNAAAAAAASQTPPTVPPAPAGGAQVIPPPPPPPVAQTADAPIQGESAPLPPYQPQTQQPPQTTFQPVQSTFQYSQPVPLAPQAGTFNVFSLPPGPGIGAPPSNDPETQISAALMAYCEQMIRQVFVEVGIALLFDPNARQPGNAIHDAIHMMRWNGAQMDQMPPMQLNQIARALSAHQVACTGVENFWEARYQVLARERDAMLFRKRENYPGATKGDKENACISGDPQMRELHNSFVVAQSIALATRNLGERFVQLENGLKRTIENALLEMRTGQR